MTAAGQWTQTPLIATPDNFSFYFKAATAANIITYRIDWSNDISFATVLGTSGNLTTTSATSTNYSVNLIAFTNVYVRITYVGSGA